LDEEATAEVGLEEAAEVGVEETPEVRHRCSPRRQLWPGEREREHAGGGNESGAV
jgi:hypothetical protein